jgi:saccharopine dehydrogenase-like NADP-dependent oxidoreductase
MVEMSPTAGKQATPPLTIVFFGLGAVGSSMLICLAELAERDGIPVRFKVFSIDPAGARDALYHAERLMKRIEIIGVPSFEPLLALEGSGAEKLAGASLLVNAAIPQFNCPIIELGIRLGAHTLDLASDMYNPETASSLTFNQYAHDAALQEQGVAALVNMGISPGITNFLIGDRICRISSQHRKDLDIESIDLYLLEDIDADAVIFSWAPAVALDELSQSPLQLRDGRMIVHEPFTASRDYQFPHEPRAWRQYPLYQEELLSLHRSYPQVENIAIYTGGSEVELVKALHQLNLLSKETLGANPELTIEAVVRAAMPGMKKPRRIEDYLRSGVIRRTHFCAAAEIRVSESVRNERQTIIETVGLSFLRYRELLGTPYAGATYISYPTAVGAAILGWHTLCHVRAEPGSIRGVVTGEDLARLLPQSRIDAVRRDLVAWDIDLFESTRDAVSG